SSGSSTRRGASFCVAQEASIAAVTSNRAAVIFFRGSGISASINDNVSRLHLDATRQTTSNNVADSDCGFNRRNANFSNQSAVPHHEHFRIGFDALTAAKT